jgi:para-aminobenzoate synthetase
MQTLLIDNYDSFTFNLFQLIAEVNGDEPLVVRNDDVEWAELESWGCDNIVISPGPGRPERQTDFGVCADAIRFAQVPLLGVCLGHQGIAHLAGGRVEHAPEVMHGRLSRITHHASDLFAGIPQGFEAVRYHSLCVGSPLPPSLEETAWSDDGVVMALRDLRRPRWGVQFHPESVLTLHGRRLLENFRDLTIDTARPTMRRPRGHPRTVVPLRESRPPDHEARLRLLTRVVAERHDCETAFLDLFAGDDAAWWLDSSASGHPSSRFSFMGGSGGPLGSRVSYDAHAGELTVVRGTSVETRSEPVLDYLARELDRCTVAGDTNLPFAFDCGFVGYLGYEVKVDCGGSVAHRSRLPDAMFRFVDRMVAFDHVAGSTYVLALADDGSVDDAERWLDEVVDRLARLPQASSPPTTPDVEPVEFRLDRSHTRYLDDIARCKELLHDGETYEICLTDTITTDVRPDPLVLYRVLRRLNPAPFAALLLDGEAAIACSSPERFLRVGRDGEVEARPIKGTAPRGASPDEDAARAARLRTDPKTVAENLMITDLLRNDLGLVCEIGSVHVPELFEVESYETVHQLVSTIRGRLRPDLEATDCIRACFPGGSMTGAPKRRTMALIDELEGAARGVYSGAIGYLGLSGGVDLNIVIRTIVVERDRTSIGTGGAVVVQSDAEAEFEEAMLKARVSMDAVQIAAGSTPAPSREDLAAETVAVAAPRRPSGT